MNEGRPIPFRKVLPAAELLLCAALVWPLAGFLVFEMRHAVHANSAMTQQPALKLDLQRAHTPEEKRAENLFMLRIWIPALLNLPCVFVGLARRELVPNGVFSELLACLYLAYGWRYFLVDCWARLGGAAGSATSRIIACNLLDRGFRSVTYL
jgi:hypothetical protein